MGLEVRKWIEWIIERRNSTVCIDIKAWRRTKRSITRCTIRISTGRGRMYGDGYIRLITMAWMALSSIINTRLEH